MKKTYALIAMLAIAAGTSACRQSTAQKIENKAEDMAHETGQAAERTGESVKDAVD